MANGSGNDVPAPGTANVKVSYRKPSSTTLDSVSAYDERAQIDMWKPAMQ